MTVTDTSSIPPPSSGDDSNDAVDAATSAPIAAGPGQTGRGAADRARLLADVSLAGSMIAPSWPLTTFVAVNPLGSFVDRPFHDAVAEGRRWFGADGYLSVEQYRQLHREGAFSTDDLDRAIRRIDGLDSLSAQLRLGGRPVDLIDVVRADLLEGPTGTDRRAGGPDGSAQVDELVSAWCAAYVDDDEVAWAMPNRELGLYRAWRSVAAHDPALGRLVGRRARRSARTRAAALADDPVDALAAALDALDVDQASRLDQLRAWLARTPGWASFARWCDDWAPADHPGVTLRTLDLLAVRASIEVLAPEHQTVPSPPATSTVSSFDLRRRAIVERFGDPDLSSVDGLAAVVAALTDDRRQAVLHLALEGRSRDELLSLIDAAQPLRVDPADVPDVGLDAQVVCCIDVRSEGLRRRLEQRGAYETFGFAGFFGVPVRWRPLGSEAGQARCPVLVSPQHEIVERPLDPAAAEGYVRGEAVSAGAAHARHAGKTGLGSPFALAESMGWFTGPLAAARTFAPRRRRREFPELTEALVRLEDAGDVRSGLSLDERTLFAEAIIATIGFRRFAPLVVLCGHGAVTVNNPHGSSLDCGACGGAPGGASARIAAAIMNDRDVRVELHRRSIDVPDTTWFVAAEHDTVSDEVTVLDTDRIPETWRGHLERLQLDLAAAGADNAAARAVRLPGDATSVRARGSDWAEVRPEWGLAGNQAFVIGPRSMTADVDLGGRAFLHSYDAELDTEGKALETIMTAPLVVGQWISSQYHFSTTAPDVFGAGDKALHNPVGGVGVLLGGSGDLAIGLPAQSVGTSEQLAHRPVRLLAVIEAPLDRVEQIVQRNAGLRDLVEHEWIRVVARRGPDEHWSERAPGGVWSRWSPADESSSDDDVPTSGSLRSETTAS